MSYRVAICVRVDGKLMNRFDEAAELEGYTRSEAVREAIRRFNKQLTKRGE